MDGTLLRVDLLRTWQLYLQVPAPLRHGSPSALYRQSLADNLQPHHSRLSGLPARHSRRPSAENSIQKIDLDRAPTFGDYLVQLLLSEVI